MGLTELTVAFGLMLVFEGMMPFAVPAIWRETFRRAVEMRDGQLRFVGAVSMLIGLLLIVLANN